MQKTPSLIFLLILIILALCLAACAPADTPTTPVTTPTAFNLVIPTPPTEAPGCTAINIEPTPGPETVSLFPPISAEDHVRGADEAAFTLMLYNDFQCVECNYLPMIRKLLEEHPEDVRVVYRHYPYSNRYDKSELAARAAEAASAQGKFWELHDLLFDQQKDWVSLPVDAFEGWILTRVGELGLDTTQFKEDFNSEETISKVQEAGQEGLRIGIPRLPYYLINGQIYSGPVSAEAFDQVVRLMMLGERQFSECPPIEIDPAKHYLATLETEKGEIVLQLYADKAPLTVNSFVFLARNGWFDGITFHRVLPGFVAQTGDPSGTGQGTPGYVFTDEIDPTLLYDQAGVVGMANSGPDTNGSQFFITYDAAPHLNKNYTIFGKVLSGMEVLEQLTPRDPQPGNSLPPGDRLIRVTIEEK